MSAPTGDATSGAAAYERLRAAITTLELMPGTLVSEGQLVATFGFSKAAVRAALARLRGEGMVVAEPRRGHVVAPVTIRDVLDIYDLRLLLEPPATAAAAERLGPAQLARLRELAEPDVDSDDDASLDRFVAANRSIHLALVQAAGNDRASRIVERLLDDSERARRMALRSGAGGRGSRARDELQSVLAALDAGDGALAGELMAGAIRTFRDELVESLQHAALDRPIPG